MSTSPSEGFVKRTRDPSLPAPKRYEPATKEPGSFVLTKGRWVEVEAG